MATEYSPIQHYESKALSIDLLNSPSSFYMHNRRYSASVILSIVYGRRIPEWDCPEIHRIFAVLGRFVQCRKPGQWLVDVFPELAESRIFNAFSTWKKVGKEFHDADEETWMGFWNEMVRELARGEKKHCFGRILYEGYEKQGLNESQAAWIW
jgi:hypothetical protein